MAKRDRSVQTFLSMILVFIMAAGLFFFLITPKREHFFGESTRTLPYTYRKEDELDKQLRTQINTLDDRGEMLLYHRGYQFTPSGTDPQFTMEMLKKQLKYNAGTKFSKGSLSKDIYMKDFDVLTCSFADVQSKIMCIIQQFYEERCVGKSSLQCSFYPNFMNVKDFKEDVTTCNQFSASGKADPQFKKPAKCNSSFKEIKGPIYVLITQAPYYKDRKSEDISAQFTISEYGYKPSINNEPIYYYVQVIFARYDSSGKLLPTTTKDGQVVSEFENVVMESWRPYFSSHPLLFIKTKGSASDIPTYGGCATTEYPYSSICLGPARADMYGNSSDPQKTPSVFAVLYKINETYSMLTDLMDR